VLRRNLAGAVLELPRRVCQDRLELATAHEAREVQRGVNHGVSVVIHRCTVFLMVSLQ
jgi:hypothetical protein